MINRILYYLTLIEDTLMYCIICSKKGESPSISIHNIFTQTKIVTLNIKGSKTAVIQL